MGNTQGRRQGSGAQDGNVGDMSMTNNSPAPQSPLGYPTPNRMDSMGRQGSENMEPPDMRVFSGWPVQPKLVPTVFKWTYDGMDVQIEGSFDNWSTKQQLQRHGKDFIIIKLLPPGVYQYKFIVDNEWKFDPNQRMLLDEQGNVNNIIEVQEYIPDNVNSLSAFEAPPSPPASYNNALPTAEDYAKEPPSMPPHLALTLLNVPPAMDATAVLPRPQHVVLNHIFVQRSSQNIDATVLGVTHRYMSKYISTVVYKPRRHTPQHGRQLSNEDLMVGES